MDVLDAFKASQREGWAHFAPLASITTAPAARLVRHAGIRAGDRVLDVACGTGVVAVTAARLGAFVTGLDLTPELLAVARDNARSRASTSISTKATANASRSTPPAFDVVVSQFGHIFAPRPDVALGEMLRVLKTGGTIAFSTWPPELFVGRTFALVSRYLPPPPPGVAAPPLWGDPNVVRERLGALVHEIVFDRDDDGGPVAQPAAPPRGHGTDGGTGDEAGRQRCGRPAPEKLAAFRQEYERLVTEYFRDNTMRQGY